MWSKAGLPGRSNGWTKSVIMWHSAIFGVGHFIWQLWFANEEGALWLNTVTDGKSECPCIYDAPPDIPSCFLNSKNIYTKLYKWIIVYTDEKNDELRLMDELLLMFKMRPAKLTYLIEPRSTRYRTSNRLYLPLKLFYEHDRSLPYQIVTKSNFRRWLVINI